MRRQLPYLAAAAAGLGAAWALRGAAMGDVGKALLVGLSAIAALYAAEYLLSRRR